MTECYRKYEDGDRFAILTTQGHAPMENPWVHAPDAGAVEAANQSVNRLESALQSVGIDVGIGLDF